MNGCFLWLIIDVHRLNIQIQDERLSYYNSQTPFIKWKLTFSYIDLTYMYLYLMWSLCMLIITCIWRQIIKYRLKHLLQIPIYTQLWLIYTGVTNMKNFIFWQPLAGIYVNIIWLLLQMKTFMYYLCTLHTCTCWIIHSALLHTHFMSLIPL